MANPLLRHYQTATFGAGSNVNVSGVVGANRALAVSKITVANLAGASVTFTLHVGAAASSATQIGTSITLAAGQVYTETGLVVLAGESIFASTTTTNGIAVNVFGEEIDN